jgi:hypothetical protein
MSQPSEFCAHVIKQEHRRLRRAVDAIFDDYKPVTAENARYLNAMQRRIRALLET